MSAENKKAVVLEHHAFATFRSYITHDDYDHVYSLAKKHMPERLARIEESYRIDSVEVLLDKLGVDYTVDYKGKRYAIDVTIGGRSIARSKIDKLGGMKEFFDELGYEPVVIRSTRGLIPRNIFKLINMSSRIQGVADCRLGSNLSLVKTAQ